MGGFYDDMTIRRYDGEARAGLHERDYKGVYTTLHMLRLPEDRRKQKTRQGKITENREKREGKREKGVGYFIVTSAALLYHAKLPYIP